MAPCYIKHVMNTCKGTVI